MTVLSEILSSRVRAEVFRILFVGSRSEVHLREIERRSGLSVGAVQTELRKLEHLGLIIKKKDGNRLYYRANSDHPLYPDIRNIVLKTVALGDVLRDALLKSGNILIAFVFGSFADDSENFRSDIDLLVIGGIGLRQVSALLSGVSESVGREINPYVMSADEFLKRRNSNDHFISSVLASPKLFIIGNENELKGMG